MCNNDKLGDRTPTWQIQGLMLGQIDSKQDCVIGSHTLQERSDKDQVRMDNCEGTQKGWGGWYIVLCLFLDNSDSPSIVEQ